MGEPRPPLKEWAEAIKAQWRAKYGRDELEPWKPVTYLLPSQRKVIAMSVSQCRRYKALGAVKVDG